MFRPIALYAATALTFLAMGGGGRTALCQEEFSKLVGGTAIQPVAAGKNISVPYITWGGDVATFLANGGLQTEKGSIYQTAGLQMQLVAGDDFVGQVKN